MAAPRTPPIVDPPIRLAVCVSGSGTTLQNLIDRIDSGLLKAQIVQVVASKPEIGAISRARRCGIATAVVPRAGMTLASFSRAVFEPIRNREADLVVLAGFLSLLAIPPEFEGRVINIHPSLFPAFCGKGFYGERVQRAVLESGVKISGCTVHFASNEYDSGPIILQRPVPVLDSDTPASLASRVFDAECDALPDAIELYAAGRLVIDGNRVRIRPRHALV